MEQKNLNDVPSGERVHIGFFGRTNAGKSSLVNAVAGQEVSIVSDIRGTTTDPVKKAMEILPIGAVMLFDTAGLEDESALGKERTAKTYEILRHTDIALVVVDGTEEKDMPEVHLMEEIQQRKIPYIVVYSKCDVAEPVQHMVENSIAVSAKTGRNITALKEKIGEIYRKGKHTERSLLADIITKESVVLLVTPIDASAPKGRLILPQVQTIRALLDAFAVCITVQPQQLAFTLSQLKVPPALIITDSQVFGSVKEIIPESIPLTSFSILMARYKGVLEQALDGIRALRSLKDGDHILISEGCSHHRQCGDIGTVKLPAWIRAYTGKEPLFAFTSGGTFPEDVSRYAMIIHCGGCMLNAQEMDYRQKQAAAAGVPFANYGMVIAEINGILERSLAPFDKKL